ncbi:MAG TPA: ionic transporter y4hA, partial [Candidatus Accumulibacter sp.]|nr:ionic transporter y4hA [Accumulibacter sp.]
MTRALLTVVPLWSIAVPLVACALLAAVLGSSPGWALLAL